MQGPGTRYVRAARSNSRRVDGVEMTNMASPSPPITVESTEYKFTQGGTRAGRVEPMSDEELLDSYPQDNSFYSVASIVVMWMFALAFFLAMSGFVIWGGIQLRNRNDCNEDKARIEAIGADMKVRFMREVLEARRCLKFCNTTQCDTCCSACDGDSAPIPPPYGHPDKASAEPTSACGGVYGSLASAAPTSLCRFGPLDVSICGFENDETVSVLESPLIQTAGFGQGTVIASVDRNTLVDGRLCKPSNAATGPNTGSRFTIQGDQTGFTVTFTTNIVTTGSQCNTIICPALA